jgi:uncharacterized coiled-coil protein SlyX
MPTIEERLAAVEQELAEIDDWMRSLNEQLSVQSLSMGSHERALDRVTGHLVVIDKRLDSIDQTLADHTMLLNQILSRLPGQP